MNDIQCLIDRQLGIYCRLNYDNVLKRLMVDSEESFYGLQNASVLPSLDQDPPIFACRFCEAPGFEHILALANEDGRVAIQDTTSAKTASALESFQCHNNAIFDLVWIPGEKKFVTASGDHTACVWEAGEGGAPRRVHTLAGHSRSVKCAAAGAPGTVGGPRTVGTGARDGAVVVWDVRAGRPAARLQGCHAPPRAPHAGKRPRLDPRARAASVTGLAFQGEYCLLSCGECDPNIKLWDLRKSYSNQSREPLPRLAIPYCGASARTGYSHLLVDAAGTRLYASCMDDVIYCFNVATYSPLPERRYLGHENSTFYIKTALSPDGLYLASGSSDKRAHLWGVRSGAPVARLAGHRAEVTCAAWGQRGDPKLVTCGDDARHMVWRVGPEWGDSAPAGRAEPPPRGPAPARAWGTPPGGKRAACTPPERDSKRARHEPRRAGSKRCLAALLGGREGDEAEGLVKRLRLEPPDPPEESDKRPREVTPPPAPPPQVSPSPPTRDLPDYVRSGEAPHLRLMSPPKKRPDTPDWLTRLARERRSRGEGPPGGPPDPPPPRRASTTDRTPKAKKGRTLLKYFAVTDKPK